VTGSSGVKRANYYCNRQNPGKQIRRNGFLALGIVTVLYIFANIAYLAAGKLASLDGGVRPQLTWWGVAPVPKADLKAASLTSASLFFIAVFGSGNAVKGLNFLIALSAFGNIIAVLLGTSRLIRECGRYGIFTSSA